MKATRIDTTHTLPGRVTARLINPMLRWYRRQSRPLPWRQTRDPYAIWISEIMLQQTQVKTVLPYWKRWMQRFPDIHTLAEASESLVLKMWEGLGYYSRARNLQEAAIIIRARFQGRFPRAYSHVLSLPGVGPYTAGAICSIAFDQPVAALDGNVRRVLARAFALSERTNSAATDKMLWDLAQRLSDRVAARKRRRNGDAGDWNQSLMDLGALVCTPRKAVCPECPIEAFCQVNRTRPAGRCLAPRPGGSLVSRYCWAFAVQHAGKWLVRQRSTDTFNAGLWEFPNLEVKPWQLNHDAAVMSTLGFTPAWLGPFLSFSHSITRNRFHLTVFQGVVLSPPPLPAPNERWVTLREADRLPFAAAHRKTLTALERNALCP